MMVNITHNAGSDTENVKEHTEILLQVYLQLHSPLSIKRKVTQCLTLVPSLEMCPNIIPTDVVL